MRAANLGMTLAFVAAAAFGQGTITHGSVTFERTSSSFDSTPAANLVGVPGYGAIDHLFEHGWWYRLGGGTQETPFGAPGTQFYSTNSSSISWLGLGGGAFDAYETVTVDVNGPAVFVEFELEIVNPSSSATLGVFLYHMLDADLAGPSPVDDSATLWQFDPRRVVRVEDSSGVATYWADRDAAGFLVRPFGATSVREALNDGAVTVFNNSGVPFGPGDLTAGFVYLVNLPPMGTETFRVHFWVAATVLQCDDLDGVFCDGFGAGSTAVWSSTTP